MLIDENIDPETGLPYEEDKKPEVTAEEPVVKKPISITPMDATQEDTISRDIKKEITDTGLTGLDHGIRGVSQISAVLQEAMARRRGNIEGKDANLEIQTIRKGQDQLDQNIQRKEALRGQLQQRLAEREKVVGEEKLKREELGIKQRKEAIDTATKSRTMPSDPSTVAFAKLLKSRGITGADTIVDETGKEVSTLDRAGLEKALGDHTKTKADETTPLSHEAINQINVTLADINSPHRLKEGATKADMARIEKLSGLKTGFDKAESAKSGEARRQEQFKQGFIEAMPEDYTTPQQQRSWFLHNEVTKEGKKVLTKLNNDMQKGKQEIKRAQVEEFGNLDKLMLQADQGNALAAQSLINRLPRVFGGEKGVLTDKDVERLSGSLRLDEKVLRFLQMTFNRGYKMSERDSTEIKSVLNALRENKQQLPDVFMDVMDSKVKSSFGENANARWILGSGDDQPAQQTTRQAPAQVGGKSIVKQFTSKSTGKTKYVYSDGTEEIK